MPCITYVPKNFRNTSVALINRANSIVSEYAVQGFSLTLRQLYYQMVARDIIPNSQQSYKRLGSLVADARLAGLVDWNAIEDRTRTLRGNQHWMSPEEILDATVRSYKIDKWQNQSWRIEVWIEKDALVGVISGICRELDINYFSCRGYTSISEMWKGAMRLARYMRDGQTPIVLHFGDHDPSGIDMTRDIRDRLELLADCRVQVERIALNMDQVEVYDPPPNPTKLTDSRAGSYISIHGYDSWELDALEPSVIVDLIREETLVIRDQSLWDEMVEIEESGREQLQVARNAI